MIEARKAKQVKRFVSAAEAAETLSLPSAIIQAAIDTGHAVEGWTLTTAAISGHALAEVLATMNEQIAALRELTRTLATQKSRKLRAVQGFEPRDGRIRYEFDCVVDAKHSCFDGRSVRKAIETGQLYEDFGWKWADDPMPDLSSYVEMLYAPKQAEPEPVEMPIEEPTDPLVEFVARHRRDGYSVPFADLYARFCDELGDERHNWSKVRVSRELPKGHRPFAGADNKRFVANVSFDAGRGGPALVVSRNGRLAK